jgi:hypothetical protein
MGNLFIIKYKMIIIPTERCSTACEFLYLAAKTKATVDLPVNRLLAVTA